MKLVFLIGDMSHSGGTERVLSIVSDGLCAQGHQVTIVSLTDKGPSFFPLNPQVRMIWLHSKGLNTNIPQNLCRMLKICREEKPDFWIDVDYILGVYSALLKLRHPSLRWISWEHFNYFYPFTVFRRLRRVVQRISARFADAIVVLSDEDKQYYLEHLHIHGLIRRIYDPTPFEQQPCGAKDEKFVLAAGRLTHVKGFDMLIDIWSRLEDRFPEWRLFVAGEGEDRNLLEAKREQMKIKRMHFIGRVRDIENYYRRASCFALPSRGEGFVMVLMEAMAFSAPAVAFGCKAGVHEAIIEGQNGFIIEEGDLDGFAEKLAVLMCNDELRARMGDCARTSVERFSQKNILEEWSALLAELKPGN